MDEKKLQEALKGIWNSLNDEQKEKAKACKSMDELTTLAGKESIELPDELLDAVAGGFIYRDSSDGRWYVVDSNGKGYGGAYFDKSDAEHAAMRYGQSTDQVSEAQVAKWRRC